MTRRVCFVSNFNTFYRNPVFEAIAADPALDVRFVFYSKGSEAYWLPEHGVARGDIEHVYLRGFDVAGTRITPALPLRLLARNDDVYLKCLNGRFALPLTYLVARLRRRPFVLWTEVWMRFRTPAHRLGFPIVRHILRNADAIVACGEHVAGYLKSEGVRPDRIVVARHAVDNLRYGAAVPEAQELALRQRLGVESETPLVLFVGRLTAVKGLEHLLEAFAQLVRSRRCQGATLVLAGAGEEEAALRARTAALGLDGRVRFSGYVAPSETVAYYAAASVLVLPSIELDHMKETWGLVVNEAFNQGLPVIATDAVGAAAGGLVRDGETGFVVPQRNAAALADRIAAVLADEGLRRRLGDAARAEIVDWTQVGMGASFRRAIHDALERSGARRESSPRPPKEARARRLWAPGLFRWRRSAG